MEATAQKGSTEDGQVLPEPAGPGGSPACDHNPDPSTAYTSTGLKANLRITLSLPVEAKCLHCGQWIRCEQYAVTGPDPVWRLKYPEQSCIG